MKLVYIRQCVSVSNVKKMHSNDIFAEVHVADVGGDFLGGMVLFHARTIFHDVLVPEPWAFKLTSRKCS